MAAKQPASAKAPPKAGLQTVPPSDTFVAPASLKFDPKNPRFIEQSVSDDADIVRHLYDTADVSELVQSIMSAGYVDFEPMIVLRKGNLVLEGNRRLAALRILTDKSLRAELNIALPDIPNPQPLPSTVRVRLVDTRDEARGFIGFKHINGPFKWDALAKAKFAAEWFESGADIGVISRTLGDNHNTVRRLVNGWYALKQAMDDGFDINDRSKKAFSFSHLYTALTRSAVREFVGLSSEDLTSPPHKTPIPKSHRENLRQLMSWLYGQESRDEPTLIQSQNPNLNELSKVLGHPEAKRVLMASRSLSDAYKKVFPASSRFEDALMKAAKIAEDTLSLAGSYDGDSLLVKVAEGLAQTTRSLLVVMKEKAAEAQK